MSISGPLIFGNSHLAASHQTSLLQDLEHHEPVWGSSWDVAELILKHAQAKTHGNTPSFQATAFSTSSLICRTKNPKNPGQRGNMETPAPPLEYQASPLPRSSTECVTVVAFMSCKPGGRSDFRKELQQKSVQDFTRGTAGMAEWDMGRQGKYSSQRATEAPNLEIPNSEDQGSKCEASVVGAIHRLTLHELPRLMTTLGFSR